MLSIARDYDRRYGSAAPLTFARDLMAGDPATFKAGYSAENAVLATRDAFDLTEAQTELLRRQVS